MKKDFVKRFRSALKKAVGHEEKDTNQTNKEGIAKIEEKANAPETDLSKTAENEEAKPPEAGEAQIETTMELRETKPRTLPKRALICIGEYPAEILKKRQTPKAEDETGIILIDKSSEEMTKRGNDVMDKDEISGLDANIDTQFWYQVSQYLCENQEFFERIRSKLENNTFGVLTVSPLWDGIGAAMPPALIAKLKEWGINTVTLGVSPSKLQPSAAHFNAFSSIGMCLARESTALILVGRDQINSYVGVDRTGSVLKGNIILDKIVDLMLTKTNFVNEFAEMSRSFGVKAFTILAATGASLEIYGSLENILNSTTFRPLQAFDLASASVIYVLARLPNHLKERLTKDKIELIVVNWLKDKTALKSVHVTEPLYIEDLSDRVDLLILVGGFEMTDMLAIMKKKAETIKTEAIEKGAIKEKEWKDITKNLA